MAKAIFAGKTLETVHALMVAAPAAAYNRQRISPVRQLWLRLKSVAEAAVTLVKQNIIVLEDDADIGNLVCHHLQLAGFNVRVCVSGDEVLPLARKQAPVLFLLDIMVPGNSGFEVCRQIRESRNLARIPIIFLTAKAARKIAYAALILALTTTSPNLSGRGSLPRV